MSNHTTVQDETVTLRKIYSDEELRQLLQDSDFFRWCMNNAAHLDAIRRFRGWPIDKLRNPLPQVKSIRKAHLEPISVSSLKAICVGDACHEMGILPEQGAIDAVLHEPADIDLIRFDGAIFKAELYAWAKKEGRTFIQPKHLLAFAVQEQEHDEEHDDGIVVAASFIRNNWILAVVQGRAGSWLVKKEPFLGPMNLTFGFLSKEA